MGRAILTRRNINRYTKTYPFIARTPRYVYTSDDKLSLESGRVDFLGGSSVIYDFQNTYNTLPTVVATSLNNSFSVSVSSVTLTSATITASAPNNESASVVVLATE
jgi:hypothetical protein